MKSFVRCFFVFFLLSAAVVHAGEIGGEWTVYGPYYRLMHRAPDGLLKKDLPAKLRVGSQTQPAVKGTPADGKLDITALMGKSNPRRAFYVCIPIQAAKDETMRIGAGADWSMDLYLNGQPVGDTLMDGNVAWPPTNSDHIFTLNLKRGKNLLVVGVMGGLSTQQLLIKPDPAGKPQVVSTKQFGKEKLPPVAAVAEKWKNGTGKAQFQPN